MQKISPIKLIILVLDLKALKFNGLLTINTFLIFNPTVSKGFNSSNLTFQNVVSYFHINSKML